MVGGTKLKKGVPMKIPISIVIGGLIILNHFVLVLQYGGSSKTCDYHFDDVIDVIKRIDTGRNLIAKVLYLFKIIPVFLFTTPAFLISFCQKKANNFIKNNYYEEIPEKVPVPEKIPVPAYKLKNPSRAMNVLYEYMSIDEYMNEYVKNKTEF